MPLELRIEQVSGGNYERATRAIEKPVAQAVTAAMRETAATGRQRIRVVVAAAGFSRRWQNRMRVIVEPLSGASIDASVAFIDRSFFTTTFELGAVHTGKPFMWIALDTVPFGVGHSRLTPAQYKARLGQPLFSARGARGVPLLVGKATSGIVARASSKSVRFRKKAIKGGIGSAFSGGNVPLYVGISSVTIKKKFEVSSVIAKLARQFPELYYKQLKADQVDQADGANV